MTSIFEQMGGLSGTKNLADEFYTVMEQDSNAKELRDIHPEKIVFARKNLYRFLTEWLGGPKLFGERHVLLKASPVMIAYFKVSKFAITIPRPSKVP